MKLQTKPLGKKVKRGLIGVGIIVLIIIVLCGGMIGSNDAGYFKVKQGRVSGNLSIVDKPGWHIQSFAKETEYSISDTYYFSKSSLEGGGGAEADPIKVRFVGGGTADIDGSVKFRLPSSEDKRIRLHKDFRSYKAVVSDLIRQYSAQVLKNTATLMKAEDTYAGRKGEFNQLFEEQLRNGIYRTKTKQVIIKDADGNELTETIVEIDKDEKGNPKIGTVSPFKTYEVEIMQVVIKDIDYDDKIDGLIAKKQEAEQQKIVARADAEKAKQDAITAQEQGKARIAKAEADENVEKIKAVTQAKKDKEVAELQAQKEFEVAKLNKQRAEEEAKALLVKKEAEAAANKLLVQAGLTPKEAAEIERDTKIGIARELSKVDVPEILISGNENGTSPMDAISVNMLMDIIEKLDKEDEQEKEVKQDNPD